MSFLGISATAFATGAFIFEEISVHKSIICCDHRQTLGLRTFHDEAAYNHLLEDEVRLVKVKDEIKFADVGEVSVEHLHKVVNTIQHNQLIVILINTRCKVQTCVPLKHYFVLTPL